MIHNCLIACLHDCVLGVGWLLLLTLWPNPKKKVYQSVVATELQLHIQTHPTGYRPYSCLAGGTYTVHYNIINIL